MIYTYLLKSFKDGKYYIGIAKNPEHRLESHNKGDNRSTSYRGPWELVYMKGHSTYAEARKHEKWLKKKNMQYKQKLEMYFKKKLA